MDIPCSVCFQFFKSNNQVSSTFCGHIFHTNCISKWLDTNNFCPECRANCSKTQLNILNKVNPETDAKKHMAEKMRQELIGKLEKKNQKLISKKKRGKKKKYEKKKLKLLAELEAKNQKMNIELENMNQSLISELDRNEVLKNQLKEKQKVIDELTKKNESKGKKNN